MCSDRVRIPYKIESTSSTTIRTLDILNAISNEIGTAQTAYNLIRKSNYAGQSIRAH